MDYPVNPTDEEKKLAWNDAGDLIAKFDWLAVQSLLAHLLAGTYRDPPGRPGPILRDGQVVDTASAQRGLESFKKIRDLVRQLEIQEFPTRKVLDLILERPYSSWRYDVIHGFIAIQSVKLLESPRSPELALLYYHADLFARYVLLVTNRPVSFDDMAAREFFDQVLAVTGWAFSKKEVGEAWFHACKVSESRSAKSAGLRMTNAQRAELKQSHSDRGLT